LVGIRICAGVHADTVHHRHSVVLHQRLARVYQHRGLHRGRRELSGAAHALPAKVDRLRALLAGGGLARSFSVAPCARTSA